MTHLRGIEIVINCFPVFRLFNILSGISGHGIGFEYRIKNSQSATKLKSLYGFQIPPL